MLARRGHRCARFAATAALLWGTVVAARGQNFGGGFSFVLPGTDTASQRLLPAFPAAPVPLGDFVGIDADGHFSASGRRVRFFGVNAVAAGAFPGGADAPLVAGRLRKLGFNLVRLHHLDNPWSAWSLFEQGSDTRHLNPQTVDRLDRFVAELAARGIRVDVNLHVSRTFRPQDGVPDADSLLEFGKGVTLFDPQLIALQREYARQLLTHVNIYRGRSLADDPAMAVVEITNENSLHGFWRRGLLVPFASGGALTVRHTRMLDSLWHGFLAAAYGSTANIALSWGAGASPIDHGEQISDGGFETQPLTASWTLEQHGSAQAVMGLDSLVRFAGAASARVRVLRADGVGWHLQWSQPGLTLERDTTYVAAMVARADSSRDVVVALRRTTEPWTIYASATYTLGTTWRPVRLTVRAPATVRGGVRLSVELGASAGSYWFDDVSLKVAGLRGLEPAESLETRTVRRTGYGECRAFTDNRVRDIGRFYLGLQAAYFDGMRAFLRDSLGVRVPVVGTNWNYGPGDLAYQSRMDYMDNHSYWDHPQFPSTPWSPTDWTISNLPMVTRPDGATIAHLMAGVGLRGKPYTVSEYMHCFPNLYQTEGPLFLGAYGGFHDIDGLMFYEYSSANDSWDLDAIAGFFSVHRNPAWMALMPSVAAAFRGGLVGAARTTVGIAYHPDDVLLLPKRDDGFWLGPEMFPRTLALRHAVRVETFASPVPHDPATLPAAPAPPFESDTRELVWDPAGALSVGTPRFSGIAALPGAAAGLRAGDLLLDGLSGFATVTWLALDDSSVATSRRSLLTLATTAQNSGMVWDGSTTVHENWGAPPTRLRPVRATFRLHIRADSVRVVPLGPTGAPAGPGLSLLPASADTFAVTLDQESTPTPWFGIEAVGRGAPAGLTAGDGPAGRFELEQNFPNPFNAGTTVGFRVPAPASRVRLTVHDLLGREVAVLVNDVRPGGRYQVPFDASRLASGLYVCRIAAGGRSASRAMLLVR